MIAKLSCELPKNDPFFSLTPTTRKWRLPILIDLLERIGRPEQLVGNVPPEHGDRPSASISAGLISRPCSALKVPKAT